MTCILFEVKYWVIRFFRGHIARVAWQQQVWADDIKYQRCF